ncbi:MAG: tetratricopeptide repeat protein, partial [Bacteroidota bacterium]
RGMAYLNTNQPLKAFVDFAVSNNHHALNFLAMEKLIDSVLHLPDTSQTLYYLDEITSSAPHFTEGYVQKFKIHQARNQWKEIEDNITRALRYSRADADNRKHAYLMTLQAIVYARFGHHEDAIKVFEEVIKLDKKNALAYFERAKVLLALGKTAKAENDLNQASSLGYEQAKQLLATMTKSK